MKVTGEKNGQRINPRIFNNCKYICSQHKSPDIYKTNANSHKNKKIMSVVQS